MRGNLWTLVVAAVGAGLLLRGAGQSYPASSPANSTQAANDILQGVAPIAGQLTLIAGVGALLLYAMRV